MRPALSLLRAILTADIRKACPDQLSRTATLGGAVFLLTLFLFGAGVLPALVAMVHRSVSPLVFDAYLSFLLISAVALFPTGVTSKDEREFMLSLCLPQDVMRRFEVLHAIVLSLPLTLLSALPLAIAGLIVTASVLQATMLYLVCVLSGLTMILLFNAIHRFPVFQGQRLPVWVSNAFLVLGILLFLFALRVNVSRSVSEQSFTPGQLLSDVHACLTGTSDQMAPLLLAAPAFSATILFCWRVSKHQRLTSARFSFRGRQSLASKGILACAAPEGRQSSFGFISGVLMLYFCRAPRLNLALLISIAYAWSTAAAKTAFTTDVAVAALLNEFIAFFPAFIYAGITAIHDRYSIAPYYIFRLDSARVAHGGLVLASLLSIIVTAPLIYALMRGSTFSLACRGTIWLMLAIHISYLLMQAVQPHLPLSQPAGRLAGITTLLVYIVIAQIVSLSAWFCLSHLPEGLRSLWLLIVPFAVLAIPLNIVAHRRSGVRLRYISSGRGTVVT